MNSMEKRLFAKPDDEGRDEKTESKQRRERSEELQDAPLAQEGWKTANKLTAETGVNYVKIQDLLEKYAQSHPDGNVIRYYRYLMERGSKQVSGRVEKHYSPEAVAYVLAQLPTAEPAPDGWKTLSRFGRELHIDNETTEKLVQEYKNAHPDAEMVREYRFRIPRAKSRDIYGPVETHYSPDVIAYVSEKVKSLKIAPGDWKTLTTLAREAKLSDYTLEPLIKQYQAAHPNEKTQEDLTMTRHGRAVVGFIRTHYAPEVCKFVMEEAAKIHAEEYLPEGWITLRALADSLHVNTPTVEKIADEYKQNFPERLLPREYRTQKNIRGKVVRGENAMCYPPELSSYVRNKLEAQKSSEVYPPEGWITRSQLSDEVRVSLRKVRNLLEEYKAQHPAEEAEKEYNVRRTSKVGGSKGKAIHVSPGAAAFVRTEVKRDITDFPPAPEGWLTKRRVSETLNVDVETVEKFVTEFFLIDDNLESDHKKNFRFTYTKGDAEKHGFVSEHYSPQLIAFIEKKVSERPDIAPEGWSTIGGLQHEFGGSHGYIESLVKQAIAQLNYSEVGKVFRGTSGPLATYYQPEVCNWVRANIKEFKTSRESEKAFTTFMESLNESDNGRQFKDLISLFGPASGVDLLYVMHPEFKGIAVERLRQGMAEYLGNYLITPPPFSLENLIEPGVYLKNENLRQGLIEVIKSDCLHSVLLEKKKAPLDDTVLFVSYFDNLKTRASAMNNTELNQIITDVELYYRSVLSIKKPEYVVDSISPERAFPDIYQQINIREIADKKRLLIADEMGVGKSASAILAKENLGVRTALIVVPSNTESTWQKYLSDRVTPEGKQEGYFRQGNAPSVLVLETPQQLIDISSSNYDYIIVSHEKLNARYTSALKEVGYDMLIVDEIHKLKNIQHGMRAENLLDLSLKIKGDNQYLALLSGTPVPNKVEDVAMLLKLLHPDRFAAEDNKTLTSAIIKGDLLDLRTLLVPHLQMKSLGEHIEMPRLDDSIVPIELSPAEADIYQVLLEEDEMKPTEKIQLLRQFLLNHELLNVTPGLPNSKIEAARSELQSAFQIHDKVTLFANKYIENVIRGEQSILPQLNLPADITVRVIHGEISQSGREAIQNEFQQSSGKMLLVVSGETADVGVDYSSGQGIYFYNEPWRKADKDQQKARVFRPGVSGDIESKTLVTKGTIEEGMHRYIETKYRAVEKLLKGIPITELEQELLQKSERSDEPDLEVNAELAEYYFSAFDKMNKIFAAVKEMGEKDFQAFLERYATEYAECYQDLGSRSYQGNASRVCASIIQAMAKEQGKQNPTIVDIASGPEMLRRHSREDMQSNIVSIDLNEEHFSNREGSAVVGSFTRLPFADGSMDYANLSLAFHYTKFLPSRGEYERAQVLEEVSRVLKPDGRAVINMIYSLDFKNLQKFSEVAELFGLRVVNEYSGEAVAGSNYQSRVITLEKAQGIGQSVDDIMPNLLKEDYDGLKLLRTENTLKDSRRIISNFTMGGKQYSIDLNERDRSLLEAEQQILTQGQSMKQSYGSIEAIPREEIINNNFVRLRAGKKYMLFKKLAEGGAVVVK